MLKKRGYLYLGIAAIMLLLALVNSIGRRLRYRRWLSLRDGAYCIGFAPDLD
jgi:DMSO/TMAO reductase YedYZ heme-binding membrane subunit